MKRNEKIAWMAMLLALAFVLSFLERMLSFGSVDGNLYIGCKGSSYHIVIQNFFRWHDVWQCLPYDVQPGRGNSQFYNYVYREKMELECYVG